MALGYGLRVADRAFEDPRLAALYDPLDPDRSDLDLYAAMVAEFGARTVLDVGCGTGTFACLLARQGIDVVAVDPAGASLDVAATKAGAERVRWLRGDATTLPDLQIDLATMTANVAQVFVTDEAWTATLKGVHKALRPGGHFAFETRDPTVEAWREWNREHTYRRVDIANVGVVETWLDVTEVAGPLVSFRGTCRLADGEMLTSESTLRFRSREEVAESLVVAGLTVAGVRDAPDRPGREFVFIATRG
jgi:SAM-dependent methyltransferase